VWVCFDTEKVGQVVRERLTSMAISLDPKSLFCLALIIANHSCRSKSYLHTNKPTSRRTLVLAHTTKI
jgi:hypothetical protein